MFGPGKIEPRYRYLFKQLQIIIISVDADMRKRWEVLYFVRRCKEDDLDISFFESPCTANPTFNPRTGKHEYKDAELWHLVTPEFCDKCNGNAPEIGLAVAVSHHRALWQSEANNPEWCMRSQASKKPLRSQKSQRRPATQCP